MTKAQGKTFRTTLENINTDLQEANKAPIAAEATSDEFDRIQQAAEREFVMGGLERNFTRMREVTAALRRLDNGTFGICARAIQKRQSRCARFQYTTALNESWGGRGWCLLSLTEFVFLTL